VGLGSRMYALQSAGGPQPQVDAATLMMSLVIVAAVELASVAREVEMIETYNPSQSTWTNVFIHSRYVLVFISIEILLVSTLVYSQVALDGGPHLVATAIPGLILFILPAITIGEFDTIIRRVEVQESTYQPEKSILPEKLYLFTKTGLTAFLAHSLVAFSLIVLLDYYTVPASIIGLTLPVPTAILYSYFLFRYDIPSARGGEPRQRSLSEYTQ